MFNNLYWKYRHLFSNWYKKDLRIYDYPHPHRLMLVDKISKYAQFKDVVELGCGLGLNIWLLAKKYPETTFLGFDINKKVIEEGKNFIRIKNGITNVILQCGDIINNKQYCWFDRNVTFTDAFLIYVNNKKIKWLCDSISRATQKAIVLCEFWSKQEKKIGKYYSRDYENLFPQFKLIEKLKITKDIWNDKLWSEYGYIMEFTKCN